MKDEIKELYDFVDEDELMNDLSLPELNVIKNEYSFCTVSDARIILGNDPTVRKFIDQCEAIIKKEARLRKILTR